MNKLVSVIVPVYNAEKYIAECIESILKQTYKNFELILVDDGSTDSSSTICKAFANQDSRIRYLYKENGGVSTARNIGISMANGTYAAFVDSDDFIKEDMLAVLMKNEADFSMCGYELFDDTTNVISGSFSCPKLNGYIADLANRMKEYISPPFLLGPCFKLFKLEIVKTHSLRFPPELSYGEDAVFVFEYLQHCLTVSVEQYIGYIYRKHGDLTLSSRFLPDKIDINKRINVLIGRLMETHGIDDTEKVIADRLLDNFVSYTKELVKSDLSFKDKKEMFYMKYDKYKTEFLKPERLSQKLIFLAGNHKFCYAMIYLFRFAR